MLAWLTHPCLPEKADRRTRKSHCAQLIRRLHKDPAPQVPGMKKKRVEKRCGWHGNAPKLLQQHLQASFCISQGINRTAQERAVRGGAGGTEGVTPTISVVQLVGSRWGGISTEIFPMITMEVSDFPSSTERGHDEKNLI